MLFIDFTYACTPLSHSVFFSVILLFLKSQILTIKLNIKLLSNSQFH